MSLKNTAVEQR